MKKHLLIILLLFIGTVIVFPQIRTVGSDSVRIAEYKKAIGLDTTVPDFDTKKIDAKVMGSRLANLLNYLLENYNKDTYELQIAQILGEQHESLQHLYYKIKKMQFANASKQGDTITVLMNVWPDKNKADVNQANMVVRFVDGVSDDRTINDLFSFMSRYVEVQEENNADSDAVVTNSFWDNWYFQFGADMNLFFPYGCNMKDVFPNGKSFGVDVAVGKWFTPSYGGRFKLNWENGLIKSDHNDWLSPGDPGGNYRQGGFITFIGDIQFNLHNLFGVYRPDRKWNLIVAPRAGGWVMLKNASGAHVLGLGIINTYRLSERWRLYADVGYHFVSSITGKQSGLDHGSNGFANINVGVEFDISTQNRFYKARNFMNKSSDSKDVVINSFWDNWFVQAGIGMSLINPYGTNIANVFPNGSMVGVNLGMGKWFTPEVGLRGGLNWQNGLIVNHHAHYLDANEENGPLKDRHDFLAVYGDFFFNFHNIFGGYKENRTWNAIVYPRMGIVWNFASYHQECPVLGIGTEHTFRIGDRLKLYADLAYQVTTGGFLDGNFMTGSGPDSNGWFDLNVGVQYELGETIGWNKSGKKQTSAVYATGHNWPRFIVNTGASVVVGFGVKTVLKKVVHEERPDHSDNKSFPSGHAAMAFAAARSIDKEFRKDCIWIPIAGYAAATAIGVERVVNKHHHWYDVVAGAGIGIGSAELTWWLSNLCFGKGRNVTVGSSGNTVDVTYSF